MIREQTLQPQTFHRGLDSGCSAGSLGGSHMAGKKNLKKNTRGSQGSQVAVWLLKLNHKLNQCQPQPQWLNASMSRCSPGNSAAEYLRPFDFEFFLILEFCWKRNWHGFHQKILSARFPCSPTNKRVFLLSIEQTGVCVLVPNELHRVSIDLFFQKKT